LHCCLDRWPIQPLQKPSASRVLKVLPALPQINYLAVFPSKVLVALPNTELPELVGMVVDGVLKSSDFSADEAQVMAWEEKRLESKYAKDLVQVDNGKKISPDRAFLPPPVPIPSDVPFCSRRGKPALPLNLTNGTPKRDGPP
jgi:hypothetical protein